MSASRTELRPVTGSVSDATLLETRVLLERALAAPLRLEPRDVVQVEGKGVGWQVLGQLGADRLGAATEVAARLLGADQEIRSLCGEVLERYEEATLVYRLSDLLAAVLGEEAIAELIVADASRVLGARSGEMWLRRGAELVRVAVFPGPPREAEPLDENAVRAAKNGHAWLREADASGEAAVAVPLPAPEGEPLGVLVLRGRPEGRAYRTGEVKLLTAIASLTAAFIRNDRLAAKARQADARRREDEIARQVHCGLLPREDPRFAGLEISGGFRAAENVGGDYYGYVTMPDDSLGLAIADVSGHGVGAALYMAAAKGAIQSEARRLLAPSELLRRTNELLVADFSEADVFATAVFLRFHRGGRRFDSCNAGHNPPLILRADGNVEKVERGGPALGVLRGMKYAEESRALASQDLLIVYTDGVVEARGPGREQFGLDRLIGAATGTRGASARAVREQILGSVAAHCGDAPPSDDITLVVVRCI
jgi:sigma-B regulation protein RsbU (phosphoserine phosphatase)